MAETRKLPEGFHVSDGRPIEVQVGTDAEGQAIMQTVIHEKGVTVGPHEPAHQEERTFECPTCGNSFAAQTDMAVCHGLNIKVRPEDGSVYQARVGLTNALDAEGVRVWSHSPIEMNVVTPGEEA